MKKTFLILFVLLAASILLHRKKAEEPHEEQEALEQEIKPEQRADPIQEALPKKEVQPAEVPPELQIEKQVRAQMPVSLPKKGSQPRRTKNGIALPYTLEDGLVVVQGDLVVGTPAEENPDETGWVEVPTMHLWESNVIPYHIDSSLKNPERVRQALALFQGTAIQFVPFANQKDALVFVDGNGTCKSYVGKIGGHQPIWLPADCGPREIAHELMHALGFVHEQNRSDRDDFIQVNYDNIDEKYKDNFEKLPPDFMKASGLGNFDFESLMIYPVWMFAKSGHDTMQPKVRDQRIQPSSTLSRSDRERINRLYGRNEN